MFSFWFNSNSTSSCAADGSNESQSGNKDLYQLFLETLISYGIPAITKIVVIAVSASLWRGIKSDKKEGFDNDLNNPAADLYRDLYSGDDEEESGILGICNELLKGMGSDDDEFEENNNRGVPPKQYIIMHNLNQRYCLKP